MPRSLGAHFPIRLSLPRAWTPSGRSSRLPPSEIAVDPQIGVDLTPVAKIQRVFDGRKTLLTKVFTPEELRYSFRQRRPFEHLAARYAAKEAVFKGLQTGMVSPVRWQEVEIVRGSRGEPRVVLRGAAARLARSQGFRHCAVSLSHAGDYAVAAILFSA